MEQYHSDLSSPLIKKQPPQRAPPTSGSTRKSKIFQEELSESGGILRLPKEESQKALAGGDQRPSPYHPFGSDPLSDPQKQEGPVHKDDLEEAKHQLSFDISSQSSESSNSRDFSSDEE